MTEDQHEHDALSVDETRTRVLAAALPNVAFDGWSDRTLADAVRDVGVDPAVSRLAFPRGGLDLAIAYHNAKDAELAERIAAEPLDHLRYSEKVARVLEMRLEVISPDREAVRKAASMFALPHHAGDAARLVWQTADTVWVGLGDTSDDVNWYTKRATLSAVWSSVLLYWLGDESPDFENTRAFIARRIDNVMQFEKFRSQMKDNPIGRALARGPGRILDGIRSPGSGPDDLPGRWRR